MPRFTHDCSECKPLGEFGEYDLYFCDKGGTTVIARFGSEGPDYTSGLVFADYVPAIAEAKRRAVSNGLLLATE